MRNNSLLVNGKSLRNRSSGRQTVPYVRSAYVSPHNEDSSDPQNLSPVSKRFHSNNSKTAPKRVQSFEFEVPYTAYPLDSFQPTLPQRCFMANPLYTFSRFKRQLLGSSVDMTDVRTPSQMTSRSTKRANTVSTRPVANPDFISQTVNITESKWNQHYFELQTEQQPVIVAVEPKGLFFETPQQQKKSSKCVYQGPNFPFNLNYMLSHLKNKKKTAKKQEPIVIQHHHSPLKQFSVYKRKSNSALRQFYTECLRISESHIVEPQKQLVLRQSTAKPIDPGQPRMVIKNKEVAILSNIFTRHKPNQPQKISLSELQ